MVKVADKHVKEIVCEGKHLFQSHFPAYNIYPDDANLLHRKSKTNQLLSNFFRASSRHLMDFQNNYFF